MNFTPIARPYFSKVDARTIRASADLERAQMRVLRGLLDYGKRTEWGRAHGFASINTPREYAERVKTGSYEDFRHYVMRMVAGEKDVLCPGVTKRYAQSSGTSGGKSKYIPLPGRSLKRCHYAGSTAVVARYLANYPDSRIFSGRSLILGGSYANELNLPADIKVGDLSASLIDCINPVVNLFRSPDKKTALLSDWNEKLPRLVEATRRVNIVSLSGVPSWFLAVLRGVLEAENATHLHDVWPSLEVFFHGGISFAPYRKLYNDIIDPVKMRYMETYNASEGFFALQASPGDEGMLLLADNDVYYEFVPLSQADSDSPAAIPAWEVVTGETYALVITSSNGLWRYMIGDTVKIVDTDPLKIKIAGRVGAYINTFGEELMVCDAEAAITRACAATGASVTDYTAAPVYTTATTKGRHQWAIAFDRPPADLQLFAEILDRELCNENSDYQAKRSCNIFLAPAEVTPVNQSAFDSWLLSTGKLGGQRKIPRLRNDRDAIDKILEFNNNPT
ncbi:MAG: GH3 auxin-responsive promoter family protein [Muribaculaceae bacterium]|nr:GH3 auxin-responsive promoter family protein [Muribaculaceae bacterium]